MRSINLSDDNERDAPVAFEPVSPESGASFALENGEPATSVKIIKNTFASHFPAIQQKAATDKSEVEDLLLAGDPEIDFAYAGKISSRTKTIYLDNDQVISYHVRFKEKIQDPKSGDVSIADQDRKPANISNEIPITWTGRFIPIKKAVKLFAVSKIYQLRHVNGLTYDFLYEMATRLHEKKAFMMVGAGPGGKEPLRFSRGGPPYRAFLMGQIRGESYRLTMHLTNLELKELQ